LNLVEVEGEEEGDGIVVAWIAIEPDFTGSLVIGSEDGRCHCGRGARYDRRIEMHGQGEDIEVV